MKSNEIELFDDYILLIYVYNGIYIILYIK